MDIGEITPLEIEALIVLDGALSSGEEQKEAEETPSAEKKHAWPTRKAQDTN